MATQDPSQDVGLPTRQQADSSSQPQQTSKPESSDPIPPPLKSKTQPYYSVLPQWSDVTPIPQADIDPSNPPLAAINYTPRYTEAMSYLRAVMAANEFSERCLALTEDLISMNPAHYTVWIYRMRILKALWGFDDSQNQKHIDDQSSVEGEIDTKTSDSSTTTPQKTNKTLLSHIQSELDWLNNISAKNLKNYQIYQHRHNLVDLLPFSGQPSSSTTNTNPTAAAAAAESNGGNSTEQTAWFRSEQKFLRQILSLDSKNYHVWSYRSWLCRRFPNPLLLISSNSSSSGRTNSDSNKRSKDSSTEKEEGGEEPIISEVSEMDRLIEQDIYNNSAWTHRYFVLFGSREIALSESRKVSLKAVIDPSTGFIGLDGDHGRDVVRAEIEYAQCKIRVAPQNASPWNYLRGVLRHGGIGLREVKEFVLEFVGVDGDVWTEDSREVEGEVVGARHDGHGHGEDADADAGVQVEGSKGVRSSHAVEWLSEIYASEGSQEKAKECLKALSEKWDPIRHKYWEYRLKNMQKEQEAPTTTT